MSKNRRKQVGNLFRDSTIEKLANGKVLGFLAVAATATIRVKDIEVFQEDSFFLLTHENPDARRLGKQMASGKKAFIVYKQSVDTMYRQPRILKYAYIFAESQRRIRFLLKRIPKAGISLRRATEIYIDFALNTKICPPTTPISAFPRASTCSIKDWFRKGFYKEDTVIIGSELSTSREFAKKIKNGDYQQEIVDNYTYLDQLGRRMSLCLEHKEYIRRCLFPLKLRRL